MSAVLNHENTDNFRNLALLKSYWHSLKCIEHNSLVPPLVFRYQVSQFSLLTWLNSKNIFPYFYYQSRNKQEEIAGCGNYLNKNSENIKISEWQDLLEIHPQKEYLKLFFCRNFSPSETWGEFSLLQNIMPIMFCERQEQDYYINFLVPVNEIKNTNDIESYNSKFNQEIKSELTASFETLPAITERFDLPNQLKWQENLKAILASIKERKVNKVVSARQTRLTLDNKLSPLNLMEHLKKIKQNVYYFIFCPKNDQAFLGASPERLFKLKENKIVTEALAGTSPINPEKTHTNLYSEKNIREHEVVVSGLINRLNNLTPAEVKRSPVSTMTLSEMHHLYSRIEVSCDTRPSLDAIISALHPTASVCGSPYQEAFNLIGSLEGFSRGLYSGPLGIATHNQIECLVALRSCLLQKNLLTVFAGAGIVEGSSAEEEWQELETKIATILKLF